MDLDFTDKVVVVTGASCGIGAAAAAALAARGARLALVARAEGPLRARAESLPRARDHLALAADLATDDGCRRVAEETLQHFGRVDVLVNNAGVGARTCLEAEADMATFDRVFATNVRGVYNLTRLLLPALVASKGNIVNVSSISGSAVSIGSLPYSMSKAALDHFSQLIALELAPKGVRVNTVSPGITESKFVQRLTGYSDEQYQAWLREAERAIPLRRVCDGDDVARAILFLASDACALVTGVTLPVDGGLRFTSGTTDIVKKQIQK